MSPPRVRKPAIYRRTLLATGISNRMNIQHGFHETMQPEVFVLPPDVDDPEGVHSTDIVVYPFRRWQPPARGAAPGSSGSARWSFDTAEAETLGRMLLEAVDKARRGEYDE